MICESAVIQGPVVFGENNIVHPRASIISKGGPIVIGNGNIIEEFVQIVNEYTLSVREWSLFE